MKMRCTMSEICKYLGSFLSDSYHYRDEHIDIETGLLHTCDLDCTVKCGEDIDKCDGTEALYITSENIRLIIYLDDYNNLKVLIQDGDEYEKIKSGDYYG